MRSSAWRWPTERSGSVDARMRGKREEEIDTVDARRGPAKAKFGVEGELFQKRQELIQPIQDMVFEELKDTLLRQRLHGHF